MNNQDVLVLIVDDDVVVRETLRAAVALEGYRFALAADGREALNKLAEVQPDVVLLDVMMPGMDGFEVTRRIKNNPATILIPVILVTALDSRQERMQGIAGCSGASSAAPAVLILIFSCCGEDFAAACALGSDG